MSIILRRLTLKGKPKIKEHFLGFVNVEVATSLSVPTVILDKLNELKIPFEDRKGQACDNGANVKGKHQGLTCQCLSHVERILYTLSLQIKGCRWAFRACAKALHFLFNWH